MFEINLTLNPALVPVFENAEHVATSWQVSTLPHFTNQHFIVSESLKDADSLLTYATVSEIINDNKIFYRVMFHFSDGNYTEWSGTMTQIIDPNFVSTQLLIGTPNVKAYYSYEDDIAGELVIETEPLKLFVGSGSHGSTDWDIEDERKVDVVNSLNDVSNITRFKIGNGVMSDNKIYKIAVRHRLSAGDESDWGTTVFDSSIKAGNMYEITPTSKLVVERPVYFALKINTTQFKAIELILEDDQGNVLYSGVEQPSISPKLIIDEQYTGINYVLKARLKLRDDSYTSVKTISIGKLGGNFLIDIDESIDYLGVYDYKHELATNGITVQSIYELYDGTILLAKADDEHIYRYEFENDQLVEKGIAFTLPVEDNIGIPYFSMIPLYDGSVIVNYASNSNDVRGQFSVFRHYQYNPVKKAFTLSRSMVKEKEWYSTAISSSTFVDEFNNLFYVPAYEVNETFNAVPLSLYKLNATTFTTTKIALPFSKIRHVSVIGLSKTQFLILGGSDQASVVDGHYDWRRTNNKIYLFDIGTMEFTEVGGFTSDVPDTFYNFQGYLRRDGKIALFNSVRNGVTVGDQAIVVLDPTTYTTLFIANDMPDLLPYRTCIVMRSGDILRISAKTKDYQLVYGYISNTKILTSVKQRSGAEVPVSNLIVNAGETIYVENLYAYSTVTINGDGNLVWQDNEDQRTYDKNDLIVTRDTVIEASDYNAKQYGSISVFGSSLTINI